MAGTASDKKALELLAPAADADVAVQAILHGADAVYIGGPAHGARKKAANSIDDIRRVADFAHRFRAKVYVTFNTILFDSELKGAEKCIRELYEAGADALIVQDMGILRLDIPPIALHASTQCDIRTPEKARFLQEVGFTQLVLARELTLEEIRDVREATEVPLETFVHGALCVCYSGRCHASEVITGRSANRGECSQLCRLRYGLRDASGKRVAPDGHHLSLRDFNASDRLEALIEAGASSFKIEGRLKDADYVKNVTAFYRRKIDEIIAANPDKYVRSSVGESSLKFTPDVNKSFNRGFTRYFLDGKRSTGIWSPRTPKSQGEIVTDLSSLHNGDGISWFGKNGDYTGTIVNGVRGDRIIGNRDFHLPKGAEIHRTLDIEWQKTMARDTAERKIGISVSLDASGATATDTRGMRVRLPLSVSPQKSEKQMDMRRPFEKTGATPYRLDEFRCELPDCRFLPLSVLTGLRRNLLDALDSAARMTYQYPPKGVENRKAEFPEKKLTFADNVANRLAADFYREHGVREIEPAIETLRAEKKASRSIQEEEIRVMTTRHCILRELGKCRKEGKCKDLKFPLTLSSDSFSFTLSFDCDRCEMHVNAKTQKF